MKYEMPPEPDVNRVKDKAGFVWEKPSADCKYWKIASGNVRFNWFELLNIYGPLEDYEPKYNVVAEIVDRKGSYVAGDFQNPGDTKISASNVALQAAQNLINNLHRECVYSNSVLYFERDVKFIRKYPSGATIMYTIEEVNDQ